MQFDREHQQWLATFGLALIGLTSTVGCVLLSYHLVEIPPSLSAIAGTAAGGLVAIVSQARSHGNGHTEPRK